MYREAVTISSPGLPSATLGNRIVKSGSSPMPTQPHRGCVHFDNSIPGVAAQRGNPGLFDVTASQSMIHESPTDQSFIVST